MLPHWLQALLTEKFFNPCLLHQEVKKNEKNIFCLDCCISICPHCVSPHNSHRLLQIRRYVYNDVVKLDAASKLMDCSFVQSYTTNSAKVLFMNERPQTRQFRGSGNVCSTCDRSLQHPNLFCSIFCKIDYLMRTQGGLFLTLPEIGSDDGVMTPNSVLEGSTSTRTSSGSGGNGEVWCRALASTATTEIVRKRRSSLSTCRPIYLPVTGITGNLMNRRKKTPHRSPLY